MLRKTVLAAMIAASTLVAAPQAATAKAVAAEYPECWLNCVWIATIDGGYWICEVQMDCVNP